MSVFLQITTTWLASLFLQVTEFNYNEIIVKNFCNRNEYEFSVKLNGNFEIITNDQNSCEMDQKLLYEAADYSFYSTCLDSVIVKFDEKNIYEISSVLSSGKISINKILDKANEKIKEDTTGTEMYIFDKFNIIKCSESTGSAIIIGNSDLTLQDAYCGIDMANNAGV